MPDTTTEELEERIDNAIEINKNNDAYAAGRAKVIGTQLSSNKRMELSRLQGVDYSYGSIFADIDPILLPEVLALVGGRHDQRELYRMLLATAPDLVSIVNRKGVLLQRKAEIKSRVASLVDEEFHIDQELASIDSGEKALSGKKRGRRN